MDYEGLRQIFKSFATATLPTEEQRTGTFPLHRVDGTTAPIPLQNPITGAVYVNGVIPVSAQTTLAKSVLAALPATNTSALPGTPNSFANNFTNFPRGTIQDDKGDVRVDHTFNAKISVFGIYSEHEETIFDPLPFGEPAGANANPTCHVYNRDITVG